MGDLFNPPDVPTPQNPLQVANTQQGINTTAALQSKEGSQTNTKGVYGDFTYDIAGYGPNGAPIYTLKQTLSPEQQALYDQQVANQKQFGTTAGQMMTNANYGGSTPGQVIGDTTHGIVSDWLARQTSYLDPYFQTQQDRMENKLKNQGFETSNKGYQYDFGNLLKSQDATVSKMLADFEPTAFNQATQQYLMPLSMASTMYGMAQHTDPTQMQTKDLNIAPANYTAAVSDYNKAAMDSYNAQAKKQGDMLSGIFGGLENLASFAFV